MGASVYEAADLPIVSMKQHELITKHLEGEV